LAVCLLFLIAETFGQTTTCTLAGIFKDVAHTVPYQATFQLTTQTINGVTVPNTLSVQMPNPSQGLSYTEVAPGSSPQALCALPTISTSLWLTFGWAYVTGPAAPINIMLWHFYLWGDQNQINAILPNDPGWSNCPIWKPSPDITSPGIFLDPPICVPTMGAHWFPNRMDLWDQSTLIPVWGTYNETVHFYEYATLDGLWNALAALPGNSETATNWLPRWPQKSGYYPASVKMELLNVTGTYDQVRMTLYDFQYLWSAADFQAAQTDQYNKGVTDGKASCPSPQCSAAFAPVVQVATLLMFLFFYLF